MHKRSYFCQTNPHIDQVFLTFIYQQSSIANLICTGKEKGGAGELEILVTN
jgi:hypothetical protein